MRVPTQANEYAVMVPTTSIRRSYFKSAGRAKKRLTTIIGSWMYNRALYDNATPQETKK